MKKFKRILSLVLVISCLLSLCAFAADETSPESTPVTEPETEEVRLEPSEGQKNIVLRARQLIEIEWTPLYDRAQWGWYGTFAAGTNYVGAPYGQPVHTGYIGYAVSLDGFIAAVEDNTSPFYTSYSYYNKVAPYYSIDCSGFVSYAWGLKLRRHTGSLPEVSYRIENQSIEALEVGDCMNNTYSHAALVSDVVRDESGKVISIEIMEQTPVITQTTRYGVGGTKPLERFESYYFLRGYSIYRYVDRDSVVYTHSCAVPLDDEWCDNCRHGAPYASVSISGSGKTLMLSHSKAGAEIYYTLDGSDPRIGGAKFSSPISIDKTADVRAYALMPDGSESRILKYRVSVEAASAPTYNVTKGSASGNTLSVGSAVSLASASAGAEIYYTLDGSEPTSESKKYTVPIVVSGDCTIKAIAMGGGYTPSPISSWSFTVGSFASFDDIVPGAWYESAVEFVSGRGLFNGVSEREFAPSGTMTRGMFATVLGRLAGLDGSLSGRIGISLGEDVNVRSGPGANHSIVGQVDKNDVFSVLGEESGWKKVKLSNGVSGYIRADFVKSYEGAFTDLNEEKYYSVYVQWLWLMGISSGNGAGAFNADSNIDRESMAVMLYRYAQSGGLSLDSEGASLVFADDAAISFKTEVYALQRAGVINGLTDGRYDPDGSATRAQVATIFMNFVMKTGA